MTGTMPAPTPTTRDGVAVRFAPLAAAHVADCLAVFDRNAGAHFAPAERADYEAFLRARLGAPDADAYQLCVTGDAARPTVVGAFGLTDEGIAGRRRLGWILLDPAQQRRGIGRAIMQWVVARARAAGDVTTVDIAASQTSAPFFARFGAHVRRHTADGWGPGFDRVDMELPIGTASTSDAAGDPRYPIGPFTFDPTAVSSAWRDARIDAIATLPARLRDALADLDPRALERRYRPGGWTIRQIVHHLPDSHLNGYVRCKLALTEDTPTIRPYDQDRWARLPDAAAPIEPSLALLDALHARWTTLLRGMTDADFARTYHHPELGQRLSLDAALANYAWHGDHHLAHVARARGAAG